MASWNMLKIIRSAAELTEEIHRLTKGFPIEEKYVTVPLLREHALSILENTALGMARFDIAYRYIYLTRAIKTLVELNSECVLCKAMTFFSPVEYSSITKSIKVLRKQLTSTIKMVDKIDISKPPPL